MILHHIIIHERVVCRLCAILMSNFRELRLSYIDVRKALFPPAILQHVIGRLTVQMHFGSCCGASPYIRLTPWGLTSPAIAISGWYLPTMDIRRGVCVSCDGCKHVPTYWHTEYVFAHDRKQGAQIIIGILLLICTHGL